METRNHPAKGLKRVCEVFAKDLEALPEDAFSKSFGPKTRTVADIVTEVNMVNDHVAIKLRGEEPPEWPDNGWIKAPADFCTKQQIIEAFKQSSENALAAAEAIPADDLDKPIKTPDGETTSAERCRFITLHLWYHSGQLNFIQTLLGDDGWHW